MPTTTGRRFTPERDEGWATTRNCCQSKQLSERLAQRTETGLLISIFRRPGARRPPRRPLGGTFTDSCSGPIRQRGSRTAMKAISLSRERLGTPARWPSTIGICRTVGAEPAALAQEIDWLFIKVCTDLAAVMLRREVRLTEAARRQRQGYEGRGFPEPGTDPEMALIIRELFAPYFASEPAADVWHALTQKIRQYLAVQNKRKNLVGEGFEDVLAQTVRRACKVPGDQVYARALLYQIPGFNRARQGGKENKVDLAIVRPSMRTIVTAKWSVRADREKQFPAEYEEYCNAEFLNSEISVCLCH